MQFIYISYIFLHVFIFLHVYLSVTIFILGLSYDALIQYKRSKFIYFSKFVIHMFDCNLTFFCLKRICTQLLSYF